VVDQIDLELRHLGRITAANHNRIPPRTNQVINVTNQPLLTAAIRTSKNVRQWIRVQQQPQWEQSVVSGLR
jgi:hypothetical protein